jgi:hypothetical protein
MSCGPLYRCQNSALLSLAVQHKLPLFWAEFLSGVPIHPWPLGSSFFDSYTFAVLLPAGFCGNMISNSSLNGHAFVFPLLGEHKFMFPVSGRESGGREHFCCCWKVVSRHCTQTWKYLVCIWIHVYLV